MTAQFLLNCLRHGFLTLTKSTLLVLHCCELATKAHPYNLIAREFLHPPHFCARHRELVPWVRKQKSWAAARQQPVVFGSTTLPSRMKTSDEKVLRQFIQGLQFNLRAPLFSALDLRAESSAVDIISECAQGAIFRTKPTLREQLEITKPWSVRQRECMNSIVHLLSIVKRLTNEWCDLIESTFSVQVERDGRKNTARQSSTAPEWQLQVTKWYGALDRVKQLNERFGAFSALVALQRFAESVRLVCCFFQRLSVLLTCILRMKWLGATVSFCSR